MAEFDDNFDQDPAAEFLQREQSALAGLEDEVPPAAATQPSGKSKSSISNNGDEVKIHLKPKNIFIVTLI